MTSKINKIEQMAALIASAEIQNGQRTHWIYDISEEKLDKLAKASVSLAEKIATHAAKHEPPT